MADDAPWRISGGIGDTPDPALDDVTSREVMLQGIGFPLRPVDNVPPQGTGDTFSDVTPEGLFMQFMPDGYQEGKYYPRGAVVVGAGYQSVALQFNNEYPFPLPTGPATFAHPAFTPTELSFLGVVTSSFDVLITENVFLQTLRIQVPEVLTDVEYTIKISNITDPENVTFNTFLPPPLIPDEWLTVTKINELALVGTVLRIELAALNSGASSQVTGGWTYEGVQNTAPPAIGGLNRDQQHEIVRYSFTDLDGLSRKAELLGAIQNSTLAIVQTNANTKIFTYRIISVTDNVDYVTYGVALVSISEEGPAVGQVTSTTLDIPIPTATKYLTEEAGVGTPDWGTVTGRLLFDGVLQAGSDNDAFGIDISAQPASGSDKWRVIATSEGGSASTGATTALWA